MYGITQRLTKKIFIPILCFIIGTFIGYGGTRVIDHYITGSTKSYTEDSNNGLQHLQNTKTELQRSIEYSESVKGNIDRSAEYNGRAREIIEQIERNQQSTSTRIDESKGNISEAIGKLEENRRIFEQVDRKLQNSTTQVQSEETAK